MARGRDTGVSSMDVGEITLLEREELVWLLQSPYSWEDERNLGTILPLMYLEIKDAHGESVAHDYGTEHRWMELAEMYAPFEGHGDVSDALVGIQALAEGEGLILDETVLSGAAFRPEPWPLQDA
tara:strand:+ start:136 stop:510 length:375 start_codon:yes stop_codon:yes gene_type:complete